MEIRCNRIDCSPQFVVGSAGTLNRRIHTARVITSQYRRIRFQNPRYIRLPVIIHGNYPLIHRRQIAIKFLFRCSRLKKPSLRSSPRDAAGAFSHMSLSIIIPFFFLLSSLFFPAERGQTFSLSLRGRFVTSGRDLAEIPRGPGAFLRGSIDTHEYFHTTRSNSIVPVYRARH